MPTVVDDNANNFRYLLKGFRHHIGHKPLIFAQRFLAELD